MNELTRFCPRRWPGRPAPGSRSPESRSSRSRSRRALGGGLGAAALALVAGCSVAPPGATFDSAAIGPVRAGTGVQNFAPFPVPAVWAGEHNAVYKMVVKAKTGTNSPAGFHVVVQPSLVFWLNCIGTGKAQVASAGIKLKWSVPCGDGTSPAGLTFQPAPPAVGHTAKVYVTVSPGARWEIRIDALAPAGVTPPPAHLPAD
jgi:hypothetical protein